MICSIRSDRTLALQKESSGSFQATGGYQRQRTAATRLLGERLRAFPRLRLRRRHDVLGVVVSAETWRTLAAYVRNLEAQSERHEDAALHALIEQRSDGARFVQGTDEVIAQIDRDDQRLETDA